MTYWASKGPHVNVKRMHKNQSPVLSRSAEDSETSKWVRSQRSSSYRDPKPNNDCNLCCLFDRERVHIYVWREYIKTNVVSWVEGIQCRVLSTRAEDIQKKSNWVRSQHSLYWDPSVYTHVSHSFLSLAMGVIGGIRENSSVWVLAVCRGGIFSVLCGGRWCITDLNIGLIRRGQIGDFGIKGYLPHRGWQQTEEFLTGQAAQTQCWWWRWWWSQISQWLGGDGLRFPMAWWRWRWRWQHQCRSGIYGPPWRRKLPRYGLSKWFLGCQLCLRRMPQGVQANASKATQAKQTTFWAAGASWGAAQGWELCIAFTCRRVYCNK